MADENDGNWEFVFDSDSEWSDEETQEFIDDIGDLGTHPHTVDAESMGDLISFIRTESMGIPSEWEPRLRAEKVRIEVENTAVEITAEDSTVEIKEVNDEQ